MLRTLADVVVLDAWDVEFVWAPVCNITLGEDPTIAEKSKIYRSNSLRQVSLCGAGDTRSP